MRKTERDKELLLHLSYIPHYSEPHMANKVFGATVKNRKEGWKDAGETSGLKLKAAEGGEPPFIQDLSLRKM